MSEAHVIKFLNTTMAKTIKDLRWQIKQQQKEIDTLRRFLTKNKLIREFDDEERKRALERYEANQI